MSFLFSAAGGKRRKREEEKKPFVNVSRSHSQRAMHEEVVHTAAKAEESEIGGREMAAILPPSPLMFLAGYTHTQCTCACVSY